MTGLRRRRRWGGREREREGGRGAHIWLDNILREGGREGGREGRREGELRRVSDAATKRLLWGDKGNNSRGGAPDK